MVQFLQKASPPGTAALISLEACLGFDSHKQHYNVEKAFGGRGAGGGTFARKRVSGAGQRENGEAPGRRGKGDDGSRNSLVVAFRRELAILRKLNTPGDPVATAAAGRLRAALLEASRSVGASTLPDGPLLGMAAAQCVRLGCRELLPALCGHAASRMQELGGREVAELASAAVKLSQVEVGFFRNVARYCSSPPPMAFPTLRDVCAAASALFQSSKVSTDSLVDYAMAFGGLSDVAMPHLNSTSKLPAPRDAAELAHVLAHSLEMKPLGGGAPLHQVPNVVEGLHFCLHRFNESIDAASSRDIAMAAGAAGACWTFLGESCRDSVLRVCLLGAGSIVDQRLAEFNLQDLALIAHAFARTDVTHDGFAKSLNKRFTVDDIQKMPQKEIGFLLWAAAQVSGWADESFVGVALYEVQRRGPCALSPQDLCIVAQSLARLSGTAPNLLRAFVDEAFSRQLWQFSLKDKLSLLSALAKASFQHVPLYRSLVASLLADSDLVQSDGARTALWALAELMPTVEPSDSTVTKLVQALSATQPWLGVAPLELANLVHAYSKLLEPGDVDIWTSLVAEVKSVPLMSLSTGTVCQLVGDMAASPQECATRCRWVFSRLVSELSRRAQIGDRPSQANVCDVVEAFARNKRQVPPRVDEFVISVREFFDSHSSATELAATPEDQQEELKTEKFSGEKEIAPVAAATSGDKYHLDTNMVTKEPPGIWLSSTCKLYKPVDSDCCDRLHSRHDDVRGLVTCDSTSVDLPSPDVKGLASEELVAGSGPTISIDGLMQLEKQEIDELLRPSALPLLETRGSSPRKLWLNTIQTEQPSGDAHHGVGHTHGCGQACDESLGYGHSCDEDCADHIQQQPQQRRGRTLDHNHGHWHGNSLCSFGGDHGNGAISEFAHGVAPCADDSCCLALGTGSQASVVRLNAHCGFRGHCVQLKNTFLHIPCDHSDDESDCPVCRYTRSKSLEPIRG